MLDQKEPDLLDVLEQCNIFPPRYFVVVHKEKKEEDTIVTAAFSQEDEIDFINFKWRESYNLFQLSLFRYDEILKIDDILDQADTAINYGIKLLRLMKNIKNNLE